MMKKPDRHESILLVDDEEDIRDVLEISLSDSGYKVLTAENGDEALRIFKETNPPIVLTDIKMPVMDGIELLKKIKQENPETEVIMITGHGDMDLAIDSLKNEATDFITKPINVDALEIALKKVEEKILIRRKLQEYTESLERLIREKTELQDRLSSLGLMIGSISHGIKGQLTGLDGGIYLTETGFAKKNPDQIEEGWEIVKQMVGRIRKMVMDILFYAKERALHCEPVDIFSFASDVASVVSPKIENGETELVRNFDPDAGKFEIDPGLLHSALVNVLENAVDACIKDKSKSSHRIVFDVKGEKDHIVFEISDNGIGMNEETREKIFTLFFSSKEHSGTGMGLFISDKIIRQHGGKIRVRSTPGNGATFKITIPRTISEAAKNKSNDRR